MPVRCGRFAAVLALCCCIIAALGAAPADAQQQQAAAAGAGADGGKFQGFAGDEPSLARHVRDSLGSLSAAVAAAAVRALSSSNPAIAAALQETAAAAAAAQPSATETPAYTAEERAPKSTPYVPLVPLSTEGEPGPNPSIDPATGARTVFEPLERHFPPPFRFRDPLPAMLQPEDVAMPAVSARLDPFSAAARAQHTAYHPVSPAGQKLLIIIPFRDQINTASNGGGRTKNLCEFIPFLTRHLTRAGKAAGNDFAFLIVEQDQELVFNKGALLNVGYVLAHAWGYDYIALHDVDQLPLSPQNTYDPPPLPLHLVTAPEQHAFVYNRYDNIINGGALLTLEQYKHVNGFSNKYWGWGSEDDDFKYRIERYPGGFARLNATAGLYRTLKHQRERTLMQMPLFYANREYLFKVRDFRVDTRRDDGVTTLNYTVLAYAPLPSAGHSHRVTVSLDWGDYRPINKRGDENAERTAAKRAKSLESRRLELLVEEDWGE